MPSPAHILWVDDEIDSLRSLLVSLESAGHRVTAVTNGDDAIQHLRRGGIDLVLLDEMMTGLDGIATLVAMREIDPAVPVVMVTKIEEEELMNRAYEARADDYLIKPVRPSQVRAVIKKLLDSERIVGEGIRRNYGREMARVGAELSEGLDAEGWIETAHWLFRRQIELERLRDAVLLDTHAGLRRDANRAFFRHLAAAYPSWLEEGGPLLSHRVVERKVVPHLRQGERVLFLVLDCVRADQWMALEPHLRRLFAVEPAFGLSLLPTATPFARNALFAGQLPAQIRRLHPALWEDDFSVESSLNRHEKELLRLALREHGLGGCSFRYERVDGGAAAQQLAQRLASASDVQLYAVVYGFVDILVHKRSESEVIQEITATEAAYRALTATWFAHSPLRAVLAAAAKAGRTVVLTSDHGSVTVQRRAGVVGDRRTTTAVRYKIGRNIHADPRHALDIRDPERWGLPTPSINSNYLVASEDHFFVYPNQQRAYERRLTGTLQHGGASLEEMVVPVATLRPR